MPDEPSVDSLNCTVWSRPQVQLAGSPYALRNAAAVESMASPTVIAALTPPGAASVASCHHGLSGWPSRRISACQANVEPTYSRASGPSSSSKIARWSASSTRHVRGAADRLDAALAIPVHHRLPQQQAVLGPRVRPDRLQARHDLVRPADVRIGLDRAHVLRADLAGHRREPVDDPRRAIAGVPVAPEPVRDTQHRPRRCSRSRSARPPGPAATAGPRAGCSRSSPTGRIAVGPAPSPTAARHRSGQPCRGSG